MTDHDEIQAAVDHMNEVADSLVEDLGALDAATFLLDQSDLVHYHDPWDTAFLVLFGDDPAPIVSEFFDAWFVADGEGRRMDLEKTGVDPPVTAHYRPEGADGPSIDIEWHPVEQSVGQTWRAVSPEGEPLPDITLGMLPFDDRHPMPPDELEDP